MTRFRSAILHAALGAAAAVMIALNFTGARALLRSEMDLSEVPLLHLLAVTVQADLDTFAIALRFKPEQLVQRGRVRGEDVSLALPEREGTILGVIDELVMFKKGGVRIKGWVVPKDEEDAIEMIGVAAGSRVLLAQPPDVSRPDVEAWLDRKISHAGFNLWVKLPEGSDACRLGVFVIMSDFVVDWLRERGDGCEAMELR